MGGGIKKKTHSGEKGGVPFKRGALKQVFRSGAKGNKKGLQRGGAVFLEAKGPNLFAGEKSVQKDQNLWGGG